MKLQQVTAEIRRRAESENKGNGAMSMQPLEDEEARPHDDNHHNAVSGSSLDDVVEVPVSNHAPPPAEKEQVTEPAKKLNPLSICAAIEEVRNNTEITWPHLSDNTPSSNA